MKQVFNILLGLSLAIVATSLMIIKTDESEVVVFKKKMYNTILGEIDKNSDLKRNLPKYFDIIVIPSCYFSITQPVSKNYTAAPDLLIDSTVGYGVLKDHEKVLAIANKTSLSYSFLSNELLISQTKHLKLIAYAMKYSANPFFVYFLKDEKYWFNVIGFFRNGKISFIDENFHMYSDIKGIIKYRYGSFEKYLELIKDSKSKEQLRSKIADLKEAKAIVKNDYVHWKNEFPQDTIGVFNLFITEMNSITKLTAEQKALIQIKIIDRIRKYQLKIYSGFGIPFYGEDVSYEVKSVLTKNQFNKYLEQRALNLWLVAQASNIVYDYLKRERNIPENLIDSAYKSEVFGNKPEKQ